MDAQQTENLRVAILNVLRANAAPERGLSVAAIKAFLPAFGFGQVSDDQVRGEVQYLADKQHVLEVHNALGSMKLWRIGAKGVDFLEARG